MSWYSTGTVSVANGSATVTGTGTAWFGTLQDGWGFVGPDGRTYEILSVSDNFTLTLNTPYQGSTASGQGYSLFPTKSLEADLVTSLNALLSNYQGSYDTTGQGRFGAGTLAQPGVRGITDGDTGLAWLASNMLSLIAGGVTQLAVGGGEATGAAVQSDPSDTDLKKLMKVGAFGLGDKAPNMTVTDMNALDVSGFWTITGEVSNKPDGTSNTAGSCMVIRRNYDGGPAVTQMLSYSGATPTLWNRVGTGAAPYTWSDWVRVAQHGETLGSSEVHITATNPTVKLFSASGYAAIRRIADEEFDIRHELVLMAQGVDSYGANSKSSSIKMYGNDDAQHPGVIVFATGADGAVSSKVYICQGGSILLGDDLYTLGDAINTGTAPTRARVHTKTSWGTLGELPTCYFADVRGSSQANGTVVPQLAYDAGWREKNQDLGMGEGIGYGFSIRLEGDADHKTIGFIASYKRTSVDATAESDMVVFWSADGGITPPTEILRLDSKTRGLKTFGPITGPAVVGPVLEAGGESTGAIIEPVSNANGECIKYADGTMFCWHSISVTPVANTPTSAAWDFPEVFVGTATRTIHVTPNTGAPGTEVTGVSFANPTVAGCDVVLTRTNTTPTTLYVSAKGRWRA